jgi:hypothetical protein
MTLPEAKALLGATTRDELHDHAFGDVEVYWTSDGEEVANGYFSAGTNEVYVAGAIFTGAEARELRQCGTMGRRERNDAAGRS